MGWIVGRTVVAGAFVPAFTFAKKTLDFSIHGGYNASRETLQGGLMI